MAVYISAYACPEIRAPSCPTDTPVDIRATGGRGFVHHPSLEVNISGIAVFHELHCLVDFPKAL